MVQRVEKKQPMHTSSLKKLLLSFDTKLNWETKQQTPSNLDLEHNISFFHYCRPLGETKMYKKDLTAYRLLSVDSEVEIEELICH